LPGTPQPGRSCSRLAAGLILALAGATAGAWAESSYEDLGAALPTSFDIPPAHSEVVVDGALDERAWSEALVLELNYEVQPGENIAPPVRTVLYVTHDDRKVYFGFRAFDPDPSRIRARLSDRDEAWGDDWVGVAIDTFNDQRRAYELLSNPLGVQMDAINDDVGQNYDDSWNAIWESGGRITERGYTVEIAIPFNQIRFQNSNGEPQTWGFDAFRSYPRGDRHHIGLFPRDRSNNSYLSQTVKIVGMAGANPGNNLELLPTLTGTRIDESFDAPNGQLEAGDAEGELGATVRWGITPNVSLNAAVNPDFSQVEADVLRLNINEQFALFFPETRPFFLEGADYFNTPVNLIHTRVILDPIGAGKITGKQGRSTYGAFLAQDEITSMLFPGPEGSSSANVDLETSHAVGRYRFDFGRNSTIGATYTDRRGDDYFNQVASLDTTFRFTEADRLTASYSTSRTQYSDDMVDEFGVRDDTFDDDVLQVDYNHSVRNWWVNANYNDFGEGFRADLGFLPRVDFNEYRFAGARIWWGEEDSFHRRLAWGGATRHSERQNGELLEENIETWLNLNGPMQSFTSINISTRNQMFEGVRFDDMVSTHTWFEFQAADDLNLVFHQDYGDWIDFDNIRPATRTMIQPQVRWNLGRHFLLRYVHTYQELNVEGGRLFRAHAPEARFVWQFNTRAFIRTILQYTDIERDPALYNDPVETRTRDLFTDILFAYKVNPATAIYTGYSEIYAGAEEYDLTKTSRSFFIKLGYAWVR
jgi:hypothetical protein